MTNITSASVRVRAGKTALALFFALTLAATTRAMESDPANYYLDAKDARYYAANLVSNRLILNPGFGDPGGYYGKINESDIRLLAGQIPLYGIDNCVVAYIYLAYFGPGPLTTIDEVVKKAREVSDGREEALRNRETSGFSLYEFYEQYFPYANLCSYALIGISEKCNTRRASPGLPYIIIGQKEA